MDAIPASDNGFDAALKALEDLDTGRAETDDAGLARKPAPDALPVAAVGLADDEGPAAMIAAVSLDESEAHVPAAAETADADPVPLPDGPAADDPAPPPTPAAASMLDRMVAGRLGKFAVALGLVSSVVSAAGLIVAERTIMSAQLVVADARERQQQLEKASRLIHDLELVRDRQIELLQVQQAQLAKAPVSSAELQHRMEALQASLIGRDPVNQVVQAIRAGQADNNARFAEFGMKMARVEAALDRR